jgi:DNA primase
MRPISNSTGSNSYSQASGEARDVAAAFVGQDPDQDLINLANTVPLINIFKHYRLRIDAHNRKITCPFKSHKGGRENSPSFWYYPDTNSFKCFGCGIGSPFAHGCQFIAALEGVSWDKAAKKILEIFATDVDSDSIVSKQDFSERLEIMLDLSNTVREFRQSHNDEKSQKFIEGMCWVYDQHNLTRDYDNDALRRIVERIKDQITFYTCQM